MQELVWGYCQENNVEKLSELLNCIENSNNLDLILKQAFIIASRNGFLDIVKVISKKCKVITDDSWALVEACLNGKSEIVKHIVQNCSIDLINAYSGAALKTACRNGHLEIVKILVDFKASKRFINTRILLQLANNKYYDIINIVIKESNVNSEIFFEAVMCNYIELVEILINNSFFIYDYVFILLFLSIKMNRSKIVKILLKLVEKSITKHLVNVLLGQANTDEIFNALLDTYNKLEWSNIVISNHVYSFIYNFSQEYSIDYSCMKGFILNNDEYLSNKYTQIICN